MLLMELRSVCSYEDYDNAVWDSETRSYYCLETRKNLEKHMARFGVRIELDRKENNLKIVPFKVVLNSDTIHDCFEIDEDEEEYDEMDIINQERDLYGLCSLDKYEDYLNEELIDSSFMNDIVAKFEKINDLYQEYEDIACISEDLKNLFSGSEEAEETEPKTKVAKETPAKAPKKEKTLSLEDVRAVMADKSRKGYTAEVKALLTKRGINKLSDVDAKDYAALLAEVEVIGDAG